MSFPAIHRAVTGHDANGQAIVSSSGPLPTAMELQAIAGTVFHEVWSTAQMPAGVNNGADTTLGALSLPPPRSGTRIRFVDIPPHLLMHRTESVDYGVVIEGELTLVLDNSEVSLKVGSVAVQRGTNHAWANRSGKPCRMLFVLVDGVYEPTIAAALQAPTHPAGAMHKSCS